jgi:hypothetical protein
MTRKPHIAKRGLPLVGGDEGKEAPEAHPKSFALQGRLSQMLRFRAKHFAKDFIRFRLAVSAAMPLQPCASTILSSHKKHSQALSGFALLGVV